MKHIMQHVFLRSIFISVAAMSWTAFGSAVQIKLVNTSRMSIAYVHRIWQIFRVCASRDSLQLIFDSRGDLVRFDFFSFLHHSSIDSWNPAG